MGFIWELMQFAPGLPYGFYMDNQSGSHMLHIWMPDGHSRWIPYGQWTTCLLM